MRFFGSVSPDGGAAPRAGVVSDSHVKQPAHSRPKDGVASLAYATQGHKLQSFSLSLAKP
jgi:hypothetical protein